MASVVNSIASDGVRIEDAIRTIIDDREHLHCAWSDHRIIKEALYRTGVQRAVADQTALDTWLARIVEIRSETDNDGQERIVRTR